VNRSVRPPSRSLRVLYGRLGSVPAVARDLGVAYETARRWLVDAGVELRPKGRPSKAAEMLNVKALSRRYVAGESIAALGAAFGVSPATVRERLLEAGVELRRRPGWKY
jgi:transposase